MNGDETTWADFKSTAMADGFKNTDEYEKLDLHTKGLVDALIVAQTALSHKKSVLCYGEIHTIVTIDRWEATEYGYASVILEDSTASTNGISGWETGYVIFKEMVNDGTCGDTVCTGVCVTSNVWGLYYHPQANKGPTHNVQKQGLHIH